jgi:hypothetical protein
MDVEGFGEPTGYEQPAKEIANELRQDNAEYNALFLNEEDEVSS